MNKFLKYYPEFIYSDYNYHFDSEFLNIDYNFEIVNLDKFTTSYKIPYKYKYEDSLELDSLIFYLGFVEALSIYKLTVSKKFNVACRKINDYEIKFFTKLIKNGLGEFFYINKLDANESLPIFSSAKNKSGLKSFDYKLDGVLVPVGGGKDSVVSIELLKNKKNTTLFMINSLPSALKCVEVSKLDAIAIKRNYDLKIIKYNKMNFYNGHTPFSAVVAFGSMITALVNGIKDIALSNESSANESTVIGSDVNHQYSKSFEFETDFRNLIKKALPNLGIEYFSFLRPLSELQITKQFVKYKQYHQVFTSCNRGSYKGIWCCECPKCLFVFIMLSAFLNKEELLAIFKENMYENEANIEDFMSLIGSIDQKPFECVGTIEEVNVALILAKEKFKDTLLMKKYQTSNPYQEYLAFNYDFYSLNNEHYLSDEYFDILKRGIYDQEINQ